MKSVNVTKHKDRKKLLLITDLYPNRYNALAGIFVAQQAEELSKHYQVGVISVCFPHKYEIEHLRKGDLEVDTIYLPAIRKFFLSAFVTFPLLALPVIRRIYGSWKPDLIHVHDYRHIPELTWLQTWLAKLPLPRFLTLHNIRTHPERLSGNPRIGFYRRTLRTAFSGWSHIFTVNDRIRNLVIPFMPPERVTVLGNAIMERNAVDVLVPASIAKVLQKTGFKMISVGNLTEEKGFQYLIEALVKLNDRKLQLVIIGAGDYAARLSELIVKFGLQDFVCFAGSQPNEVVRQILPEFDAFVLPSYSESFGIVYLEALEAGIPIVGVEGQGVHGIFGENDGALFAKAQDSVDLAKKIERLIIESEYLRGAARHGQELVRNYFTMENLVLRIMTEYARH